MATNTQQQPPSGSGSSLESLLKDCPEPANVFAMEPSPPAHASVTGSTPSAAAAAPAPTMTALPMATTGTTSVSGSIPEFLFQLTKMLSDNNRHVIEWSKGRIEVHSPHQLERTVLKNYFRHSKFASFQRQLNYFGFRKLAGKGKMSPCSYVNDSAGKDIASLLLIKRKTGPSTKESKKKRPATRASTMESATTKVNPVLAGIMHRHAQQTLQQQPTAAADIAKRAVGKGVRHGFTAATTTIQAAQTVSDNSLAELESNYKNAASNDNIYDSNDGGFSGYLSRNSSLIDLAMIAPVDDTQGKSPVYPFVDFPHPEVDPTRKKKE